MDEGGADVDPIGMGLVTKAASEEATKVGGHLLTRVFGPSADEIGTALARWTAYRVGNVKRIVEGADRKGGDREGGVSPRVAHRVLEDGSWSDDTVVVDYLSGVLAGSRSLDGRDDRGVVWCTLISGMSALQLRAHY
ncbi:MAG: hypothetical protein HGA44_20705, partial [Cellulomonadaceae bacterium]|nr:hypothetical protein [Cellulomonadaceae bacterium]